MSQYDAREVADLLSRFDFKILSEQEGDFSPIPPQVPLRVQPTGL